MEASTGNAVAFTMNVATSVFIVFVNKMLMDPNKGYKFVFGAWWPCASGQIEPCW